MVFALLVLGPVPAARAAVPVLVVDGSGWGHGVGMAQDGAYWMGRAGADTAGILRQFYPGTRMARTGGQVRVGIGTVGSGAVLAFPGGGRIEDDATGPAAVRLQVPPGGQVRLGYEGGRYRAELMPGARMEAPAGVHTLRAVAQRGAAVAVAATGGRYRGALEVTGLPSAGSLRLVNELDVESYLRGMGEVRDPSWPPAALRAQAIAARTYALRAMANGGEICADERCQVYLGQQAEYAAMDEAVLRTAGQVLTFGGRLAATYYSANGGGVSATPEEGFGPTAAGVAAPVPYLRAARYPTGDPGSWSVTIGLHQAAARLQYPGELSSVSIAETGPSGRALRVALEGTGGRRSLTGIEFARALGLRSTFFETRLGVGDPAPAAPTEALPLAVRAAPVRRVVSESWVPTWPEVLLAAALAGCLVGRRTRPRP